MPSSTMKIECVDQEHLEFLDLEFAITVFCEPELPGLPRLGIHHIGRHISGSVAGDTAETIPTPSLRFVGLGLPGELNAAVPGDRPRKLLYGLVRFDMARREGVDGGDIGGVPCRNEQGRTGAC